MKHKLALIWVGMILLCALTSEAQRETENWFFGYNSGLNFNNGAPVFQGGGLISSWEGCSSVSDTSGNLLFYTDGMRVWDKNHRLMPNSVPQLPGDTISSQSSLIVRYPGSYSLYYIFTTGAIENNTGNLHYSIVDMRLNNGAGDIVPAQKNILLANGTCEKITAIKHANANDAWLITHLFNSNQFYVYNINCRGINSTPKIFPAGSIVDGRVGNAIGYLRGSPDGTKLAIANFLSDAELFDFDNITGAITYRATIGTNPGKVCHTYGIEFSPDSKLLYISSSYNCGEFGDYDIDQYLADAPDINASKVNVLKNRGNSAGALQAGPDNKIYIAFSGSNYTGRN